MIASPEERLLSVIRDFVEEHGYPPSHREMAQALGVSSTQSISRYLLKLKAAGKVDWQPSMRRTLRLMD